MRYPSSNIASDANLKNSQIWTLVAYPPKAQARPRPDFGNLGTWKSRNLESNKSQKLKFSKSKSMSPKMSARSGLAGKRPSRPHLGPSQAIFCVGRKNRKNAEFLTIFLGGPMGPIHPVWGHVLVSLYHCSNTSTHRPVGNGSRVST